MVEIDFKLGLILTTFPLIYKINLEQTKKMNDEEPLTSIIILNYNSGHLLSQCVESILRSNYHNFEIIVVDNASNDNSHLECKKKFNQIFKRFRI